MDYESILWGKLLSAGLTKAGAAGLMGNIYAESGIIPNRVEILCLKRLKEHGKIYTDATYTAFVDDGTISRAEFLNPLPGKQYGYGLCQWTSPGRKAGLYDLARRKKMSIGDLEVQVEWLLTELADSYSAVLDILKSTDDVMTASNAVLTKFEMPADVGSTVRQTRYNYSKGYYDKYKGGTNVAKTRGAMIALARAWLGKKESDGSHKFIIDVYNSYKPHPRGYVVQYTDAWCATFVSALAIKLGYTSIIPIECGCPEMVALAQQMGIWKESDTYTPQPGDIIMYDWQDSGSGDNQGTPDHVGIVASVSGSTFQVIEGNKNNAVGTRTMTVNGKNIRGYICPQYDDVNDASDTPAATAVEDTSLYGDLSIPAHWFLQGAVHPEVKSIQILLNAKGYKGKDGKTLAVDGDLGANTAYALTSFQKDCGMKDINYGSVSTTTWKYLLNK